MQKFMQGTLQNYCTEEIYNYLEGLNHDQLLSQFIEHRDNFKRFVYKLRAGFAPLEDLYLEKNGKPSIALEAKNIFMSNVFKRVQ